MRKRVNVQVSQLKILGHMQHGKGMVGLVARIQISLFVEVAQQVLLVVHACIAKLLHAGKYSHECISKMVSDH